MSVLSRIQHRTHDITLPEQRTGSPRRVTPPPPTASPTSSRRTRTAGLLAAGVVALSAAGTGTWMALDDGSPATSTPATTVQIPATEAKRDAALARRDSSGGVSDAVRTSEARRDAARASSFGK